MLIEELIMIELKSLFINPWSDDKIIVNLEIINKKFINLSFKDKMVEIKLIGINFCKVEKIIIVFKLKFLKIKYGQ